MMFGDLVRFELFVGLTTSFDPLFANFTLCKLQAWKKALGRVKRQYQDVDLGIGNQLTLPVTTVFSGHSDRSIENEMKVHCVSKTDCLVSRVLVVLPDPCLACNGPAESTWQTWERHIIQRAGWLRRLSQGATEGQVDRCIRNWSSNKPCASRGVYYR